MRAITRFLSPFLALLFVGSAHAQPVNSTGNPGTTNGSLIAGSSQFPTISSAIAALGSTGGRIYVPCGSYHDNLTITVSNVIIQGAGVNCTFLYPAANAAMVNISASATNAIQYVQIRDLTMQNQSGFTSDGIDITGPANQINDWHYFQNLNIEGFENGINLIGRTIWTTFENVHVGASLANGINAHTASVLNHIVFRDGQINNSQSYGVYWNNSNSNLSQSIKFDHVNIEENGLSGALANCAGLYISGVGAGSVNDSYFEANCVKNPDNKGADIRITGTYAQAFDVKSSLIWSQTNYSIFNDAIETTGTYEGNRFGATTNIKIATSHVLSKIVVGANFFSNSNTYVLDGNKNDHVLDVNARKNAVVAVSSNPGGTLNVTNNSYFEFYGEAYTIGTLTGGHYGQTVTLMARGNPLTLTNGDAANNFVLPAGQNITLPPGVVAEVQQGTDGLWHLVGQTPGSALVGSSITGSQPMTITANTAVLGSGATAIGNSNCNTMMCIVTVQTKTGATTGDGFTASWGTAFPQTGHCQIRETAGSPSMVWADTGNDTTTAVKAYAAWSASSSYSVIVGPCAY